VIDKTLDATLDIIYGTSNPEIHHYHKGSHPGIAFYIKTIMPGPSILNEETYILWRSWCAIHEKHSQLIRLVDKAYDWQGATLPGWWTIWLDQRIDITWNFTIESGFEFEIIDYADGLKISASKSLNWFNAISNRHQTNDIVCYDRIEEITEFLGTYTTDKSANEKRANLRVIENDKIHDETSNRNELDPKC
jgi:hypothetical protein